MIRTKVNESEFEVEINSSGKVSIDSVEQDLDVISVSESKHHMLINNKSYNIELIDFDKEKKIARLKINNSPYSVAIKDEFDMLLDELGMANLTSKVVKEVKAPMPGLVVSVEVEKGQEIAEGESLLILEAMKMENVIKSPVAGIIKSVKIKESDTVEKNTVLIEFE